MNKLFFTYLVITVLLALNIVSGSGNLVQAGVQTKVGIAPSHVNGTSIDPLFSSYSQWFSVADQIDFFKYYGCMYSWCGAIDTASMVSFMNQHGIDITCEYGDFPSGNNAAYNFSIAEPLLVHIAQSNHIIAPSKIIQIPRTLRSDPDSGNI